MGWGSGGGDVRCNTADDRGSKASGDTRAPLHTPDTNHAGRRRAASRGQVLPIRAELCNPHSLTSFHMSL